MTRQNPVPKVAAALALTGAVLCGAVGCGAPLNKSGSAGDAPKKKAELAKLVPESIAKKGYITVAAGVYAPAVIAPGGQQPTGWDIETTRQAAALLGLKAKFKIIPFDGVIPGLQAGRYDAATGEIIINPERTKVVTFVSNHISRDELLVKADSKIKSFSKPSEVCGLTLGAQVGSAEATFANKMAKDCKKSGGDPVTVRAFKEQATVNLAVSEGRIDAAVGTASQVSYVTGQAKGKFKMADLKFGPAFKTGMALADNADTAKLAKAFQAATDKLIETGALKKILDKHNSGLGLPEKAEIVPKPAGG